MIVTFSDGLQLRAKVNSQVSSAHLWLLHLPFPWRLSPGWSCTSSCPAGSWCPKPGRWPGRSLQGVTQTIPTAPDLVSTHTNPSNPHRQDLKACCWFSWKFDLTLCRVPPCNTLNISLWTVKLGFFFSLSLEREKGHQKQSFSQQIHCLSALCNRPLDIGSASDNTWIDFPPHIWKVLGMTHLTPSQMLWVQL